MRLAFAPPKPNELLNAYSNFVSLGWRTIGNAHTGSVVSTVALGGNHWPCRAMRQTTASTAPAAPSKWPTLAFVELTDSVAARSPAHVLIAAASAPSLSSVPVA